MNIKCLVAGHKPIKGLYEDDKYIYTRICQRCKCPIGLPEHQKGMRYIPPPGGDKSEWQSYMDKREQELRDFANAKPKSRNWLSSSDIKMKLPSRFQINDEVQLNFNGVPMKGCIVIKVHFTEMKVTYDVTNGETRFYNVDSVYVEEKTG